MSATVDRLGEPVSDDIQLVGVSRMREYGRDWLHVSYRQGE
ncbi:MAG TPA: hypothetical protein VM345_12660 [Acidimicrobiales bacterium]|jgi:hypothetical protein|nr:hypothetical protein [Acidimicrobiales bacterium]